MICLASPRPPEGSYWIVTTFGSARCSWEVDSGWRCHTAAACGLWPCHPKPRHFTIFARGISLAMHRHTNTHTLTHTHQYRDSLDGLQTHVSVILSSPLSSIILGWLPPLGLHPYSHPLPETPGVKTAPLLRAGRQRLITPVYSN